MIYKNSEDNKITVREGLNIIKVYDETNADFNYTIVDLDGDHGACINKRSTKYWIILDGEAKVYLDDKVTDVKQGDFIIINKNTKHNIIGKVKLGLFCTPSFNSNDETYFK